MQQRRMRLGLALLSATLLSAPLVACDSTDSGGEAGPEDRNLTIVVAQEPANLDPCNSQDAQAVVLRLNVVQPLTMLNPDTMDLEPMLAESWERTSPTTWEFSLREGVTFQDGEPFDAEAAAYGINRTLNNPDVQCTSAGKVSTGTTTEVVDEYTLRIETDEPDPILPLELSYIDIASPNTPNDEVTNEPVGTGPYEFAKWNRGQYIEFAQWKDYWGDDMPEATTVRVSARPEASVRANMMRAGEADIAFPILAENATDDDRTRPFTQNRVFFLRLPIVAEPFTDMRVREAIAHAIDREALAEKILGPSGNPAGQIVTEAVNGHIPDWEGPAYDPELATSLIEEAAADGVPVDKPVEIVTDAGKFPGSEEVMQAVTKMVKDVGLNVTLRVVELGAWQELLYRPKDDNGDYQPWPTDMHPTMLTVSHDNVSGDAAFSFPNYLTSTGCCTTAADPELDKLVGQALSAEPEKRAELFQQAARTEYTQEKALIPMVEQLTILQLSDRVEYDPNGLTGAQLLLGDVTFE